MASRHRFLTTAISENLTSPFYTPASASNYDSDHRITVNIIIAGVSVACAVLFLVLTYYAILIRRHRDEDLSSAGHNGASDIEEGLGDYAVFRIRTVGLHESVINSITAKPCVVGVGAADCSVCLSGFREGDMVRLLPSCGHRFHVHCIDPWLRENISCPLCRADVLAQSVFERSVGSVDAEVNAQTSDLRVSEAVEGDGVVAVTDTSIDCIESSTDRDRRDLPGNLRPQEWRLNSTFLSLGSDLSFRADQEERSEDGGDLNREKRNLRLMQQCLQKNPVFGGCSTSNNVRFLFFSRFGRSSSSPILPR